MVNQVKCLEIEIEKKDKKLNQLMAEHMASSGERGKEKDQQIRDLVEKCDKLEL